MTAVVPGDTTTVTYTHPDGSQATLRVIGHSDSIRVDLTVPTGKVYRLGSLCLGDGPLPRGCPACGQGFLHDECPHPYHHEI
jgi:hypothetical protein